MNKYSLIFSLFLLNIGFSQNHNLGNVTLDELKEKRSSIDTSAVASYLFNVGKTYFNYSGEEGFQIVTEIDTKIKVYKKEGYDFANTSVAYYLGNRGDEKVVVSKAITYNLVGGKIEKTKLNSEGEFIEKVSKNWKRKKITMPNVKEGSVVEYRVAIISPYIFNFPEWKFQNQIPVKYSEYVTYIPEYMTYNMHLKGFFNPKNLKYSKERIITYNYKEKVIPGLEQQLAKTEQLSVSFIENINESILENLPALKDEGFVNNIENYQSSLQHELAGTKFPNSRYESYNINWESVVRTVYESDNFGNELNKTGYFENDVDALLSGISSDEEKVALIFNYIKSRMNWNNVNNFYCEDGVKKAYIDKIGNAAEINLMLIAMLRYAGIETNPVLLSTRSNGISFFPSITSFNYVIAGIENQDGVILLDATNNYTLPNILPIRDLNWIGRIVRKDGSSKAITVMPTTNSKNVLGIMAEINDKGSVFGKIKHQYFDYNAFIFRNENNQLSKENYIEKLEKKYPGTEIGAYEVLNNNDLTKPITENFEFTTSNAVDIIGDKMYFSPFLFFAETENPFKQETRQYPIDFIFSNQVRFNISIKVPDGYAIETLPNPASIALPKNMGSLKYLISNVENKIQVSFIKEINSAIIEPEYYDALKDFYKELVNKQTENVVLKKI